MTIAVSFERWASRYALRFAYYADLIALVKTVPSSTRSWDPEARLWLVDAYHARRLARDMAGREYLITGLDAEPEKCRQQHTGTDWARTLFRAVGPARADAVFRSLTRILHPDNPATGGPRCSANSTRRAPRWRRMTAMLRQSALRVHAEHVSDVADALAELSSTIPRLPGAACRGHANLFDATITGRRGGGSHDAVKLARVRALQLCECCPALDDCRIWFDSLPARQRPFGVVAGQLNTQRSPQEAGRR